MGFTPLPRFWYGRLLIATKALHIPLVSYAFGVLVFLRGK